jgi:AraC family transcriptional regulator of adaptative response / DNA-3-methyladenine glycosylase II
VARALRLISETGLEDGGVDKLAEHLGVGSRHLRRLFRRYLGATPLAVAQTRRLQFAKKLIDETTLPMNQIALAAGWGCVRRFNEAIRQVYHRTPTQIRRLVRQTRVMPENQYLFNLRFRPPYDWDGILAFLSPRATPGVEQVIDGTYRRSISVNGNQGYFDVSFDEKHIALVVRVCIADPQALFSIVERIRTMFDLNADWQAIMKSLKADRSLAARVSAAPGLRVPGCWNAFELAVRAILGQQITVKGATGLAGRIVSAFGQPLSHPNGVTHLFPTPEVLSQAGLCSIGLTRARAETIRCLATAVWRKQISFEKVIDVEKFMSELCELVGIGKWTAQYIAMRALGEPDVFPYGDLGLLRALGLSDPRKLEEQSQAWRPWRAYAAMLLWNCPAA